MLLCVGLPVRYVPHAEHDHLADYADTGIAAIIGRINPDGTADLMTFIPNKEACWADAVPMGEGPHTFGPIGPPANDASEIGDEQRADTGAQGASDAGAAAAAGGEPATGG